MKTEIIIPKLDNNGADNSALIERNIKAMCELFGGATVYEARGCWVSDEGHLYDESVVVITSAATEVKSAENSLETLAKALLETTDQEAIFTSVNGKAKIYER